MAVDTNPPPEEQKAGAPLWIVSFADMSLLLLSFFIMLLAVSSQTLAQDEDLLRLLASIKIGFGYSPKDNTNDPLDVAVLQILSQANRGPIKSSQARWTSPAVAGQQRKPKDLWVQMKGAVGKPVLFSKGSSEIDVNWEGRLDEIASVIRHHYRQIIVQGHCSKEEASMDGAHGFQIAYDRAMAVKLALQRRGVASNRIRLVSCAQHETRRETSQNLRQRADVTLGRYFLPGGDDALRNTQKASVHN